MLTFFEKILFRAYVKKHYKKNSNDLSARKSFEKNLDFSPLRNPDLTSPAKVINQRITELRLLNKDSNKIIIDSNLPKATYHRIISDFSLTYMPKKENIIKLAIGLEYNLYQTIELLNLYGYTLSKSTLFDITCSFFFTHWKYHDIDRGTAKGVCKLQSLLYENTNIDIMER